MRKLIIGVMAFVVVIILLLVLFLGFGIARGGRGIGLFSPATWAPLANRSVFAAAGVDTIELRYSSDSVTILESDSGEIVLEEYMTSHTPEMLAKTGQGNGALNIQQGERPLRIGFMWISYAKLYLPKSFAGTLVLETRSGSLKAEMDLAVQSLSALSSSGSVHMQNIEAAEGISMEASSGSVRAGTLTAGTDVRMQTSSGSISAEGIACEGDVTLKSNSGSQRVQTVTGGTVQASASSGSMHFGTVTADTVTAAGNSGSLKFEVLNGVFDLSTSSGSISVDGGAGGGRAKSSSGSLRIALGEVTSDLALKSTSGSQRLAIPESLGIEFSARTSSGSIRTPMDDTLSYNQKGNEANGTYGSGDIYKIDMEASSGSVRLEWV